MLRLVLSIGLLLMSSVAFIAEAQIPPDILKAYKAYRSALEADDIKLARKHAHSAWQTAEKSVGDSKITGDLAQNFADIATTKRDENRVKAYERSMELASYHDANASTMWMDRAVRLIAYYKHYGHPDKMYKLAKTAAKYAENNNLTTSTYYGEILTYKTDWFVRKGAHKKTKASAEAALKAFENANDGIVSVQPLVATLYSGFGDEGQDNTLEAALNYQKVMEAIDGKLVQDHPFSAQALGRWAHMRSRLYSEGRLEEAESKGLCQCWPYDRPRNESLRPIKRVPPVMPRNAWVSGYTIVEFDLDDAGSPININPLVSWPKDVFDKSSKAAVEKWKYTARTPEETDEDRKDLIVTVRYRLTDRSGNVIY